MDHQEREANRSPGHGHVVAMWARFAAMIATSIIAMFLLKYTSVYAFDHIFFSQTRFWMALMMGMAMIVIMLGFMWDMYGDKLTKIAVLAFAAVGFVVFLFLVRSQETVDDVAWAKAMIPHHSIAVLTSRRAEISDPRMRRLADDIIEAQIKEIAQMKMLIADIEQNGEMGDGEPIPPRTAKLTPELMAEAVEGAERK